MGVGARIPARDAPLSEGNATPAALFVSQDADRLAFALAEGPAAEFLAEQLASHLWIAESANGDWPENLRGWLSDTDQWSDVPAGAPVLSADVLSAASPAAGVSRLVGHERCVSAQSLDSVVELDIQIGKTRVDAGSRPEPEGMALHAYRGSCSGLERLIVLTTAAHALFNDLPICQALNWRTLWRLGGRIRAGPCRV